MTQYRVSTLDIPSIRRHMIGFDRLFDEINRSFENAARGDNYPPYNIIKTAENCYTLEFAVAGFSDNELDVEVHDNELVVSGKKIRDAEETVEYIHKGIGSRDFSRKITLIDHMEVKGASVKNGILSVFLEQIVPEEKKPKRIAITFE